MNREQALSPLEQEMIEHAVLYLEEIQRGEDGNFGGFFTSQEEALKSMQEKGYKPIKNPYDPCIFVDRRVMKLPVPDNILAWRFAPNAPEKTPLNTHLVVFIRV